MIKHYRNKVKKITNHIIFQALNWKTFDEEITETEKEYKINVFGVTNNQESVSVEISGFKPYFYIKIPEKLQDKWSDYKTKEVKNYLLKKLYKNSDGLFKVVEINKKSIDGFTNEKLFKFLKIVTKNEETWKKCKYILRPSNKNQKVFINSITNNNLEFEIFEGNIEPFIRFCHQKDIKLSGWIKIDSYEIPEEDVTRCQINIKTKWGNVEPYDKKSISNIRIAAFDIECVSERAKQANKNIFPDYERPNDRITQIGTTFYDYETKNKIEYIATIKTNNDKTIKHDSIIIEEFESEEEIIKGWVNTIRKMDPDLLIGYNSNNFDWNYIYERSKKLLIEWNLYKLSRFLDIPAKWKQIKLSTNARGDNEFRYLDCPGVLISDLMTIIKQNFKLAGYKLNEVAQEFIGDQKEDLSPLQIFHMAEGTDKEILTVLTYCVKDCTLLIDIMLKKCIISNTIAMSSVCHVPYEYIEYMGQQIKVHSQLLYESRLNDFLVPTLPYKTTEEIEAEDEKFEGATVIDPNKGAYFKPVSGLDFASLYPSIMIANNYSFETIVKHLEYDNIKDIEYKDITWTEDEGTELEKKMNVRFVQNKMGILPIILDKLWKERKAIKKDMKVVKNKIKEAESNKEITEKECKELTKKYLNEYEVLDGFQLAMKISMNSIYGFTGAKFGRFPEKKIAAAVTAEGRRMIRQCKQYLLDNYNCEVIYGDTDSVYVSFNTDFKEDSREHMEEVFKISEEAAEKLSRLFKKPIEMEFEKVMYPFIIFSKKRYACVIYTNIDNYDYIDYKGIQVVRRDNCAYVKEKSIEIFKLLLIEKDIPKAIDLARKYVKDIIEGNVPIKDLVISKSLKGWGSYEFDKQFVCTECNKRWYTLLEDKKKYAVQFWDGYKSNKDLKENLKLFMSDEQYCNNCKKNTEFTTNKANIAHVSLSRKMAERDPYNCPQTGERVPYVFKVTNGKNETQCDKVEDPKYLVENKIPIDYKYYFEHQFKSAIDTIFEPIFKDDAKLNEAIYQGIIEEKPKRIRKKIIKNQ